MGVLDTPCNHAVEHFLALRQRTPPHNLSAILSAPDGGGRLGGGREGIGQAESADHGSQGVVREPPSRLQTSYPIGGGPATRPVTFVNL